MSQTLPRLDEDLVFFESGASANVTSAADMLLEVDDDSEIHSLDSSPRKATEQVLRPPVVELAIPTYNEEKTLEASIRRLRSYLDESFPFETTIRIVDNASTDGTWRIATELAATLSGVSALRLDENGKGRAIRAAWTSSTAQVVAYMDVDLSTDLGGLLPLVAPLLSGHSDVAIGSRLAPGAHVIRGARREVVSRGYQLVLRLALRNQFSDATCGFKAARRETAEMLLPLVRDERWFFDTEFLVMAEWNGLRIHEVPVDWVDDTDSHVNIPSVAHDYLRGVARLLWNRATRQEAVASDEGTRRGRKYGRGTRYAGVGILSTIAYVFIFLGLRDLGLRNGLGVYAANVAAFALSTIVATIAHVLFTVGPTSSVRIREALMAAVMAFAAGIALTSLALGVDEMLGTKSAATETLAILLGSVVAAALVRVILLRASAYRMHITGDRVGIDCDRPQLLRSSQTHDPRST